MPNIKSITIYSQTLEIKYGVYMVKIYFNFKSNSFKAFTESSNNLLEFDIEEKKKYLALIDECLNKVGLKHIKTVFNIKERNPGYITKFKYEAKENPVCYINMNDMFNWLTVQKMKGVIQ